MGVTVSKLFTAATYQQLFHTDPEIGLVELVGDVPAKRSKLASLLHQGVEEAQTKEKLPPDHRLAGDRKPSKIRKKDSGLLHAQIAGPVGQLV